MAKFFLSTGKTEIDKFINRNSSHFSVSFQCKNSNLNVVAFSKRNARFCNFSANGNDYGIIVGTYMLDGKTGEDVIKRILVSFDESEISTLKKDMVGMWAAYIYKDGNGYVFNDYFGLYDVCYTTSGSLCIGNAMGDVAEISGNTDISEYPFIMEGFQNGAFPKDSIFANISKLTGEEYLKIIHRNIEKLQIPVKTRIKYKYVSESQAIKDISELLRSYAKKINNCFGDQSCFMTGGLDSRLVFGSFLCAEANFNLMYGQSSDSQHGDKILVEQIAKAFNKSVIFLDWDKHERDSLKDQIDVFKLIDFQNWIGNGYKPHILSFADCSKERPFYAFGYFCEAIRLRDWAEKKGKTFSLYDYIDNYYINNNLKGIYKDFNSYRSYLIEEYKKQLSQIGIKKNFDKIPIDNFERFRWMMARFCDSRAEFMLNNFGYAFSIMSIPQIHEAVLSLPAKIIKGGSFQIKVINELNSRLVREFDVFSHLRPYRITKNLKKVKKIDMKTLADCAFKILPFVKPMLIHLYRNRRYNTNQTNMEEIKLIEKMDNYLPSYINYKDYKGGLGRFKSIMIGINAINKK